jgi:hypothetical protein
VNTWRVILATLIIFGAGVITGGLLVGYSDRAAHRALYGVPGTEGQPAGGPRVPVARQTGTNVREIAAPPALRKEFLDRLNRELNLRPEQRERIETLIRQGQEQTRDLWRVEMMSTRQKIRAELTPAQQTRFQELLKQRAADARRAAGQHGGATNAPASNISSNPAAPGDRP